MSERMLIGGDWIEGTGPALASINPADGSFNAEFSTATETEVDDAVAAAKESYYSGEWRALKPHQRADYLYAFRQTLLDRKEDIARLQMRENGKTISECRGQVDQAAGIVRYFAAVCETMEAEVTPPRGDYVSMVSYEPYGVVSLITPWNSPITLNVQKLAPALAAGNSVVLKPSEVTPGVGLAMGRICQDIGIPPGVVNVVSGTSRSPWNSAASRPTWCSRTATSTRPRSAWLPESSDRKASRVSPAPVSSSRHRSGTNSSTSSPPSPPHGGSDIRKTRMPRWGRWPRSSTATASPDT